MTKNAKFAFGWYWIDYEPPAWYDSSDIDHLYEIYPFI